MTLFRARTKMAMGGGFIPGGSIVRSKALQQKAIDLLLQHGLITEVAVPPIAILPGWQHRAKRLAEIGVSDAAQVLEADVDEVARHMGISPGLFRRWQEQLESWLVAPPEKQR